MKRTIPESKWVWLPYPAHYECADRCFFRLATRIGGFIVSTVGEMSSNKGGLADIGYQRKYETLIFPVKGICKRKDCKCGLPVADTRKELDGAYYNDRSSAYKGHMRLCRKYAKRVKL